ncbi:MAG: hypothetical protein V4557_17965 [Bacteroidota bacterium]
MSAWNMIVISMGVILLVFLCRKEFIRANKARLGWRMLASVIAVVCLVCMGLPITFTPPGIVSGNKAIVLTEGADADSIQQFNKAQKQKLVVYQMDDLLRGEHMEYDSLHVFGYGLSDDELQMLKGSKLVFHPAKIISGITTIDWNRNIEKGKELLLQGTYTNQNSFSVVLVLNGFNTILDSFTVLPKKEMDFRLHTIPKQNGKAVYTLSALHEKDTLEKEPIPIEVIAASPIKVLMLAASPDFENRFVKDWLSKNGYTVVSKTAISANKFDKTSLNAGSVSPDRFTANLLDSFDVLLSDENALLSLSKPEQENIYNQVTRKGMGMIIRSDTIHSSKEWFTAPFQLYTWQGKQPTHLSIHMMNDEMHHAVLPVEQPLFIRSKNGMQPLATDSAGNIIVGMIAEGEGKISFNTLYNTYNWLLAGNASNYYAFWSGLLQKTARKKKSETSIETLLSLPVEQQPVSIIYGTSSVVSPFLEINEKKIALSQNEHLSDRWQGTYWPTKPGWQLGINAHGINKNWYVYDKDEWKYVTAHKKTRATKQYAQNTDKNIKNEGIEGKGSPAAVPWVYFFLPFIICCGFLWMERKIF